MKKAFRIFEHICTGVVLAWATAATITQIHEKKNSGRNFIKDAFNFGVHYDDLENFEL